MRFALKAARLQNPVLTNRNGIGGIIVRVSKHFIVKPKEYNKNSYVDSAGIRMKGRALTRGGLDLDSDF